MVSVQLARLERRARLLIIRRSRVRTPLAPRNITLNNVRKIWLATTIARQWLRASSGRALGETSACITARFTVCRSSACDEDADGIYARAWWLRIRRRHAATAGTVRARRPLAENRLGRRHLLFSPRPTGSGFRRRRWQRASAWDHVPTGSDKHAHETIPASRGCRGERRGGARRHDARVIGGDRPAEPAQHPACAADLGRRHASVGPGLVHRQPSELRARAAGHRRR